MARPVVAVLLRRYLSFHSDPLRAPLLTKNLFRDLLLADFQTHFLVCGDQMFAGSRYWIMLARSVLAVLGCLGRGVSPCFCAFGRVGGVSELSSASSQIVCPLAKFYPIPFE